MADQPQSNFQDNQSFEINVAEMFKHFISGGTANDNDAQNVGIDDLRSQINLSATFQSTKNVLSALNIGKSSISHATTSNTTTPGQIVQESRCHAFFRIIGFPVVDSSKERFYNPGLDIIKDGTDRTLTLDAKIGIANNPIDGFEKLSQAREQYQNNTAKIFAAPSTLEAAILSLTSGTYYQKSSPNLRKFSAPFDKDKGSDPFNMSIDNQSYAVGKSTLVGNSEVFFSDFRDASGAKPNLSSVFTQHQHIIRPFMVDPRIDFSVYPIDSATARKVSKLVSVPFVPDQTFLQASTNSYAERPLLEKVIIERFSQANQEVDAGTADQDLINYVKSFKAIQDEELVSTIFSNDVFKLSEQSTFVQYLSIVQSMIFKLVEAMRIIHYSQNLYYWLPQPSGKLGPENGSDVRKIIISPNVTLKLITDPGDLNIIVKSLSASVSTSTASASQANAIPNLGKYAFSAFKLTFAPDSTSSLMDLNSSNLDNLVKRRTAQLSKAGQALQTVEMIMGEFSGLGLSDIIAVIAALYIMPKNDLLGFLDDDAFVRAQNTLGNLLPSGTKEGNGITLQKSMTSLSNTVKSFYTIMDKILEDYLHNNALNV